MAETLVTTTSSSLGRRSPLVGPYSISAVDSPSDLRKLAHCQAFDSFDVDVEASIVSFPESLENYRGNAEKSSDPLIQLEFVEYLLESVQKLDLDPALLGLSELPAPPGAESTPPEERKIKMKQVLEVEAMKWLRRLVNTRQPHPHAQFLLAEFYNQGLLNLQVDHYRAFSLYVQASKQNHPTASYQTGVCHELGKGIKKDSKRAVQFYRKAAALGNHLAMHKMAIILLYGKLGQKKNLKEGIMWLKRAAGSATQEHPEALHDLAQCFEKRGGCPVLIPDEHYALELYARAAQWGYALSQYRLGMCYEYGLLGCQVDPSSSIKWYLKAAEKCLPESELALSSWCLTGAPGILQASDEKAFEWAKKAAEREYPRALYQVGNYWEAGVGVESDMALAMEFYAKASAKGSKRASQRLAELKRAQRGKTSKCIIV